VSEGASREFLDYGDRSYNESLSEHMLSVIKQNNLGFAEIDVYTNPVGELIEAKFRVNVKHGSLKHNLYGAFLLPIDIVDVAKFNFPLDLGFIHPGNWRFYD